LSTDCFCHLLSKCHEVVSLSYGCLLFKCFPLVMRLSPCHDFAFLSCSFCLSCSISSSWGYLLVMSLSSCHEFGPLSCAFSLSWDLSWSRGCCLVVTLASCREVVSSSCSFSLSRGCLLVMGILHILRLTPFHKLASLP
jgi:hypothetical protein